MSLRTSTVIRAAAAFIVTAGLSSTGVVVREQDFDQQLVSAQAVEGEDTGEENAADICPATRSVRITWGSQEQGPAIGFVSDLIFNADHSVIQLGNGPPTRGQWHELPPPPQGPLAQARCPAWLSQPDPDATYAIRTFFVMEVPRPPDLAGASGAPSSSVDELEMQPGPIDIAAFRSFATWPVQPMGEASQF